jgi:hypothetical protein
MSAFSAQAKELPTKHNKISGQAQRHVPTSHVNMVPNKCRVLPRGQTKAGQKLHARNMPSQTGKTKKTSNTQTLKKKKKICCLSL